MARITLDSRSDVLGLIDVQPTFMPGGELGVPDGNAVVEPANRLMAGRFVHAFATQDWHPRGHVSFASTHGRSPFETVTLPYGEQVLWPDHAIVGTPGAALHPGLEMARIEAIFRKGFRPDIDSYSAFRENDRTTPTGLGGWIGERGFRRVFLCGLATDCCVFWSAQDARAAGYEVFVVADACRGLVAPAPDGNGTTVDAAQAAMVKDGIQVIRTADLLD